MERIHLRQLQEDDRELFGLAFREEPGNEETGNVWIDMMFQTCLMHSEDEMAILLGENDEWCGYCTVFYKENDIPELAINLRPEYQGRGIGAEALRQMMSYVREKQGFKRFVVKTKKTNIRFQRMCEKLGAEFEGEVPDPLEQIFKMLEEKIGTVEYQKKMGDTPLEFEPVLQYVLDISEDVYE